ncbi:hypothetical protein K437DRAFT_25429 [Tilletiaria anomala UBC 951]|uniref:Uncharacterized protein n=1 Tax=Tilletiaria anomala (strain ATCC 24038 / CBS 436.72 / UBC 951) TaxID=1037660 RepID=A0A066WE64_TILAU|nr:uncharacterized protein K437DRAFT_25429 [Tilletiaria anomala UBC 951]KDN52247.1 hypothetical protein K437DRAFT_25429 [Tilletiaria anomala UBC 951]
MHSLCVAFNRQIECAPLTRPSLHERTHPMGSGEGPFKTRCPRRDREGTAQNGSILKTRLPLKPHCWFYALLLCLAQSYGTSRVVWPIWKEPSSPTLCLPHPHTRSDTLFRWCCDQLIHEK